MFDNAYSMWLPGFGPDPIAEAPISAPQKQIAVEVKEYICEIVRKSWPAMRADLWNRAFTPVERFEMNCAALRAAESIVPGEAPDMATRETLSLFTGWGALSATFGDAQSTWRDRQKVLKGLLKEHFISAQQAVTTSFFTPPAIVSAIWRGIERLGFKGGKVLEPSAGSGMFLSQMPSDMAKRSMITAIDLDVSASKILSALYAPYGVKVINSGFEKAKLPADFYDLVVTNVPFGDFQAVETRAVPFRDFRIHDYFLARSMEAVRPGGLVVAITTSGTMDKVSTATRAYLATKGELISAVRLPTAAFKVFAGTEPTTDILIFRRYEAGELAKDADDHWVKLGHIDKFDPLFAGCISHIKQSPINQYFVDNRDQVLGSLAWEGNQNYRLTLMCKDDGTDYLGRLNNVMSSLPENIYKATTQRGLSQRAQGVLIEHSTGLMPGSFIIHDGQIAVADGQNTVIVEGTLNNLAKERIRGQIEIRDVTKALIKAQIDSADEAQPQRLRETLNTLYDRFVSSYGNLTSTANSRAFSGDPASPLLSSLESVQKDGSVEKAQMFHTRTIGAVIEVIHSDTSEEALQVSLARMGRVDIGLMSSLTGMPMDKVVNDLAGKGAIYKNPQNREWETTDEYLSGDVKTKLSMAEMSGDEFFENVKALEAIIPTDIEPTDIAARLGSTWIPLADYDEFLRSDFGALYPKVSYESLTGSWDAKVQTHSLSVNAKQIYGTTRVDPMTLFIQALNQQVPTVTDPSPEDSKKRVVNQKETIAAREKQASIKERFATWLWEDTDRAQRLAASYNDAFNRIVERPYDGKHLTLPGFSNVYTLRPHQRDAVWRIVSGKGNTLLAHCVGAGKTLEMICAGMELKRLGLATKPCYVVPNHMLSQFSSDFLRAYPGANVMIASKEDFAGDKRRRFLTRIATNNWDAVVITHATFERIKMSADAVSSFVKDQLAQLIAAIRIENDEGNRFTVKQLERSKRQWEARLEKLANQEADCKLDMNFEDLGLDWLMVDEAHGYKNLYRFSKMSRVAGLPNSNAEKSFDMLLKTRHVSGLHNGNGGVVFATGTPVSNSMAELYTMQYYLAPRTLRLNGIEQFDAWAANYGEAVAAIEISPDGSGYRMNTRFARFTNLPELMTMFREFADIKTSDMLDLPVPENVRETISAKPSDLLKSYVASLVKRAEALRNGRVDPKVDNMLKITSDGRKAALDMRLVEASIADETGSKSNLCMANVLRIYKETEEQKLTQVIFSDLGTPSAGFGFNVYDDIKRKLVDAGVPTQDIAFAHDAVTDAAKEALSEKVRKGSVRIILGSTQKLGVGTNMQDRLIALHHLDAPWRPSDIEQREGRIVRQGNQNDLVRIYTYVTEGSFDAYIWQTLETKKRFISQIMHGETGARNAEDLELSALSYAEVKALASGNPLVIEKAGVDSEVALLSIMKTEHDRQVWSNRRAAHALPLSIASDKVKLGLMEQDALQVADARLLNIGKKSLAGRDIGLYIEQKASKNLFPGAPAVKVGELGQFTILVESPMLGSYRLIVRGNVDYVGRFSGRSASAENTLALLLEEIARDAATLGARIVRDEKELVGIQGRLDAPFAKADRLSAVLKRQAEINSAMGMGDSEMMATEAT